MLSDSSSNRHRIDESFVAGLGWPTPSLSIEPDLTDLTDALCRTGDDGLPPSFLLRVDGSQNYDTRSVQVSASERAMAAGWAARVGNQRPRLLGRLPIST